MHNGRLHPIHHNGTGAKTKSKVNVHDFYSVTRQKISCSVFCFVFHNQDLVSPNYSSSVAKPLAPWPRDQGEVSELYKVCRFLFVTLTILYG